MENWIHQLTWDFLYLTCKIVTNVFPWSCNSFVLDAVFMCWCRNLCQHRLAQIPRGCISAGRLRTLASQMDTELYMHVAKRTSFELTWYRLGVTAQCLNHPLESWHLILESLLWASYSASSWAFCSLGGRQQQVMLKYLSLWCPCGRRGWSAKFFWFQPDLAHAFAGIWK